MSKLRDYLNYVRTDECWSKKRLSCRSFIVKSFIAVAIIALVLGIVFTIPALIWAGGIITALSFFALVWYLFCKIFYGVRFIQVSGISMMPFLQDGQRLAVQSIKRYGVNNLRSGDIVIISTKAHKKEFLIPSKYKTHKLIIKRLVLVGEGAVKCEAGSIYVKAPFTGNCYTLYGKTPHRASKFGPYYLKPDEIFFLGDNYNVSIDSRYLEGRSEISSLYKISDIVAVYVGKNIGDALMNLVTHTAPDKYLERQRIH